MKVYRNPFLITLLMILFILSQNLVMASTNTKINMNFKGADIRDVLRTIAELANINLVTDSSVNGDITVHLKNLSFNQALTLVTQVHGLDYKWYENTVVVATPERIDQLYSTIMVKPVVVNHADLVQLHDILSNLYPELNIVPDQRNNSLILQGKETDINKAEALLKKLDTEKEAFVDIIAIPVEKSDFILNYLEKVFPELVVENDERGNFVLYGSLYDLENANLLINKLIEQLKEKGQDYGGVNIIESIRINHIEVAYIKELVTEMYPDVNIVADDKNNQLIYNGSKHNLQRIKELVAIIDLDHGQIADLEGEHTRGGNVTRIVKIDYASLEDLEGIITDLYPEISFRINRQNKEFIVNGRKDLVDEVVSLVKEIDIPRKQVIIEARVEEVSTTDLQNLGVNPEQLSRIEIIDKNEDGFIDGVGLTFGDFINLLETAGNSNTLARPRLMTLSGEEASLLIGDRIPVTVETVQDGSVITSVEYIEAGINLVFTPWVTSDNKINLRVNPQVSSIGDPIGTALPPINTREAETNIRLDDGETFAIGGLIQDDVIESVSKVPLLGDIPILGQLFRSRNTQNLKTELIIFITPHIVQDRAVVENNTLKDREIISESITDKVEDNSLLDDNVEQVVKSEVIFEEKKETSKGNIVVENLQEDLGEKTIEKKEKDDVAGDSAIIGELEDLAVQDSEFVPLTSDEIRSILSKNDERRRSSSQNSDILESDQEENSEEAETQLNLDPYYVYDYTLKKILTLTELAELFAVEEELIIEANESIDLTIGENIKIPLENSRIYVMEKGDTLWKVHNIFEVSVTEIKELNNIEDESNISVGTIIVIPE